MILSTVYAIVVAVLSVAAFIVALVAWRDADDSPDFTRRTVLALAVSVVAGGVALVCAYGALLLLTR